MLAKLFSDHVGFTVCLDLDVSFTCCRYQTAQHAEQHKPLWQAFLGRCVIDVMRLLSSLLKLFVEIISFADTDAAIRQECINHAKYFLVHHADTRAGVAGARDTRLTFLNQLTLQFYLSPLILQSISRLVLVTLKIRYVSVLCICAL